jgi:hypothetical protein
MRGFFVFQICKVPFKKIRKDINAYILNLLARILANTNNNLNSIEINILRAKLTKEQLIKLLADLKLINFLVIEYR